MKYLSPEEKLKRVKLLCSEYDITAYEIGKNTSLNTSGVHRILTGDSENPRPKTINAILDYVEKRVGEIDRGDIHKVSENTTAPGYPDSTTITLEERISRQVLRDLQPLFDKIENEKNEEITSILKNAYDFDEVKDDIIFIKEAMEAMKKNLAEIRKALSGPEPG